MKHIICGLLALAIFVANSSASTTINCIEGRTQAHPVDCNAYLECYTNEFITRKCPFGLHYNSALSVCDYPSSAGCQLVEIAQPGTALTDYPQIVETPRTTAPPAPAVQTRPAEPIGSGGANNNVSCPATNVAGQIVHLPHCDCTKFYQCNWGVPFEMSCPEGLHFNNVKKVCDDPIEAGCTNNGTVLPGFPVTELPQTNQTSSPTNNSCPATNVAGQVVHLSHSDCGKFYLCDWGVPIEMSCPQGLHFNVAKNVCDDPIEAGCTNNGTVLPGFPVTEMPQTNQTSSPTNNSCPATNVAGQVVHLSHSDCGKFYLCDWGVPFEMSCPQGLHFNVAKNLCDDPIEAGCTDNGTVLPGFPVTELPQMNQTSSPSNNSCPATNIVGQVVHLSHSDCGKFYLCDWGVPFEMSCPQGLHFNVAKNVCDDPIEAGCVNNGNVLPVFPVTELPQTNQTSSPTNNSCPATNVAGQVVHLSHSDCGKFYLCDWGVPFEMSCPQGLHFNVAKNVCDDPIEAGCTNNGTVLPVFPVTEQPQTNQTSAQTQSSCPATNAAGQAVYLPHSDCGKFYQCDWGVPFEMTCPQGLHFNRAKNVCDDPVEAGCAGKGIAPAIWIIDY